MCPLELDGINGAHPYWLERLVDVDKPEEYVGKATMQAIAREGSLRRLLVVQITG